MARHYIRPEQLIKITERRVHYQGGQLTEVSDLQEPDRPIDDARFWKITLEKYGFTRRAKFRCLGSKSQVLAVAAEVSAGRARNVVAVMDRDLDNHTGRLIHHPCVLYTYGYSWENDLWSFPVLLLTVDMMTAGLVDDGIRESARSIFENFLRDARRIVYCDVLCWANGSSLIPRDSGNQLVSSGRQPPSFRTRRALAILRRHNQRKTVKVFSEGALQVSVQQDCYGKVIGCFGYRLLCWLLRSVGLDDRMSKETAKSIAMSHFAAIDFALLDNSICSHYQTSVARLIAETA